MAGDDGYYALGCPMDGRFVDNSDGTVSDECTGLLWQQPTCDQNNDGIIDAYDFMNWEEAILYCESLILCQDGSWTTDAGEAENHGGIKYDDWRLPTAREFADLIRYAEAPGHDPLLQFMPVSWYYSSTTVADSVLGMPAAWYFDGSSVGLVEKSNELLFVKAVRG